VDQPSIDTPFGFEDLDSNRQIQHVPTSNAVVLMAPVNPVQPDRFLNSHGIYTAACAANHCADMICVFLAPEKLDPACPLHHLSLIEAQNFQKSVTRRLSRAATVDGFHEILKARRTIMKRILLMAALVVSTVVLSGTLTSTADAQVWGPVGYRYHSGYYYGRYRPYPYRPYYRRYYGPGVVVTTPGFGVVTPGYGVGVAPVYSYPAPYPAYGYGYYRW
jgi:hypothetical protein